MAPTVVIIPGAWQLPPAFDQLISELKAVGFEDAFAVALPTVGGTATPLASMPDDAAAVRKEIERLVVGEGREVVVYSHSYGGVVASNAVEGLGKTEGKKGGVVGMVFASAFVIPKGASLLGLLGGQPLPWMVLQDDRVVGDANMLPEIGFNDLPAEQQQKELANMSWTALGAFTSASGFEPWAHGFDCAYLHAERDNALPLPMQQGMAAALGAGSKSATEDSGHCAHLGRPGRVAEVVRGWYL